ncbi:MAG: hypothetical protein RMK65_08745 [Anaerolineae bacterium]|nr:hypothetical protein [Anaerolineae bacterium]MDW7992198.1 hypothetical protein [Anaerolineae bacterium]
MESIPRTSEQSPHCPSCGRFVGPYDSCPYCGARLNPRLPLRIVKIAALLMAAIGLLALWFFAIHRPLPRFSIGEISATMNFAYGEIAGTVVGGPNYNPDSRTLSFVVDDGTGRMRVWAFRDTVEALRESGLVPALGDQVIVAGTVRVQEEDVSLTLNTPRHLQIFRPEAEERDIGSITPDDALRRVRVRGRVQEVREPYPGLTLIALRDATGRMDVALYGDVQWLTGEWVPPIPGDSVEVEGAISLYRGNPQLVPSSVHDIRLLEEAVVVAEERSVDSLSSDDVGRLVTVRGVIVQSRPFSAGHRLLLDDGTGEITVILWQNVYSAFPTPEALVEGVQVEITGEVALYRGTLEIIPGGPGDIQVLEP